MEVTDNKPVKTSKERIMERLVKSNPEFDVTNEEAMYDAIDADYANSDKDKESIAGYQKNEKSLIDIFNKDPRLANVFLGMAKGESPLERLVADYGEDFKLALDDPEVLAKLVVKQNEYAAKQATSKKMEEEAKKNIQGTRDALDAAQEECGCDDATATKAFEAFANMLDDACVDKVSKETWIMFIKGIMHDSDVIEAKEEGEIKGKNAKIDMMKKKSTVPQGLPPELSGQGSPMKNGEEPDFGGVLGKYGKGYKRWDE